MFMTTKNPHKMLMGKLNAAELRLQTQLPTSFPKWLSHIVEIFFSLKLLQKNHEGLEQLSPKHFSWLTGSGTGDDSGLPTRLWKCIAGQEAVTPICFGS